MVDSSYVARSRCCKHAPFVLVSDRDLFQHSWWVLTGDGDGQLEAYVSQMGSTPEMNDIRPGGDGAFEHS